MDATDEQITTVLQQLVTLEKDYVKDYENRLKEFRKEFRASQETSLDIGVHLIRLYDLLRKRARRYNQHYEKDFFEEEIAKHFEIIGAVDKKKNVIAWTRK